MALEVGMPFDEASIRGKYLTAENQWPCPMDVPAEVKLRNHRFRYVQRAVLVEINPIEPMRSNAAKQSCEIDFKIRETTALVIPKKGIPFTRNEGQLIAEHVLPPEVDLC